MQNEIVKLENEIRELVHKRDRFVKMVENDRLERDMENIHHIISCLNFDIRSMMFELEDMRSYEKFLASQA